MFSSLKTCFLIEVICLSFCEASRIKRSFPVILPPILNSPGSNSLSPLINLTIVFDMPQTTCCTSCNPPTTYEPCKTCPPVTTCETCETCPPVTTCEPCTTPSPATTCEPCTTPTPVITCEPCTTPPPTICEPCETCPTPTTREASSTSSSTDEIELCIELRGIACPEVNWCVIPFAFDWFQYIDAEENCLSVRDSNLRFGIVDHNTVKEDKMICLRKAFDESDFGNQNEFWNLKNGTSCSYTFFKVENGTIVGVDQILPVSCDGAKYSYCVADLQSF